MTLNVPPFRKLDDRIELRRFNERNTITLGQLRQITEGYSDDLVVWLGTGGKSSDVRPSQDILAAPRYILIS